MKLVIIGNQARAMCNFWSTLIAQAVEGGHEVVAFLPDSGEWGQRLEELGARVRLYPLDRKGLNPLKDRATLQRLCALLKEERPDILFAYTIKALIYGSLAASISGCPKKNKRYVMITGLGYAFEANTFLKRCLRKIACLLYRLALKQVHLAFFQNPDDKTLFESFKIIPPSLHLAMCRGVGVDTGRFALAPLPTFSPTCPPTLAHLPNLTHRANWPINFILVGRLLEAKGLREYYQSAKLVKAKYPQTLFYLLGPAEQGFGAVPLEEVQQWQKEGVLEYLGESADVRPFIAKAHVTVLPSWREGVPGALLEAMSMGRALLATDVPGCREVVHPGKNGLLVPLKDVSALAAAMSRFIEEPELVARMGLVGRALAERDFDAQKVATGLLQAFGIKN